MRRFEPREANCFWMDSWAPEPRASMAITAATPIRMPNIESMERILCELVLLLSR